MKRREKRRQIHRGAEEWRLLIADWKSSGKEKRAWCAERGVGYESLRRWMKRLRHGPKSRKFVEISKPAISVSRESAVTIRIKVNNGIVIELAEAAGDEVLKRVLAAALETVDVS